MTVHNSVLYRLFKALSADFVTESALAKKEIAYCNMPDAQLDSYMVDYNREVDSLVEDISKSLGCPDDIRRLFRDAGTGLQLSLLMRYELLSDMIQDCDGCYFDIPEQIDELFKRLYIDGYRSFQTLLKR